MRAKWQVGDLSVVFSVCLDTIVLFFPLVTGELELTLLEFPQLQQKYITGGDWQKTFKGFFQINFTHFEFYSNSIH